MRPQPPLLSRASLGRADRKLGSSTLAHCGGTGTPTWRRVQNAVFSTALVMMAMALMLLALTLLTIFHLRHVADLHDCPATSQGRPPVLDKTEQPYLGRARPFSKC